MDKVNKGVLVLALLVLALFIAGATEKEQRFHVVANNIDATFLFVFDAETQTMYRYTFGWPNKDPSGKEVIILESFGSLSKPEYKKIDKLIGDEWDTGLGRY